MYRWSQSYLLYLPVGFITELPSSLGFLVVFSPRAKWKIKPFAKRHLKKNT